MKPDFACDVICARRLRLRQAQTLYETGPRSIEHIYVYTVFTLQSVLAAKQSKTICVLTIYHCIFSMSLSGVTRL